MPDHPRVFISYSHDSDEHRERVRQLAARLRGHGIDAWMDQYSPAPAEGWPRWMNAEFARADFVILVCSTGYAERFDHMPNTGVGWEAAFIRAELKEKGRNTRFIPVFFGGDAAVVPSELREYTWHSLPGRYDALLRHLMGRLGVEVPALGAQPTIAPLPTATLQSEGALSGTGGARRAPWNAPALPDQYLPRDELDAFKIRLIDKDPHVIAVAGQHHRLGVQGMPGVGKTLLAAALAWDEDVQEAFPGGVFWLTLGRTPEPVIPWQAKLAARLKGSPVDIDTPRMGRATLAELFASRPPALVILDDVWDVKDAEPFNALTPPSRLLITTRNREVAVGLGADVRELNELAAAQGLALLASYAGRPVAALPREAPAIVRECGELPLALAMAGSMLRGRQDDRWPTLLAQLQKAELGYLAAALPDYGEHRSMLAAIEVSVRELPEDVRQRFLDFAVFAEDVAAPEAVLHLLWKAAGVDLAAAQSTVDALVDRSLVRRDAQGRLTLHDLQHDYVRARCGDLKARHTRLLDAYRNIAPDRALHAVASDGYFFEHGPEHLLAAEGPLVLRDLLFDHRWLAAKLKATGVNALLSDFELLDLASDEPLRLLRDALRLSANVLSQRPEQLPYQLLGRLRDAPEIELQHLCTRADADSTGPCLLPIWPSLQLPGGPLLRTLEGHADVVNAVVLSADGKTAVSSSDDKTLKVWNVETGQVRRTLQSHGDAIKAVALSADGTIVISASWHLKVWDVETGQVRQTLKFDGPHAVALSLDWKTIVSASWRLKVWDVETGQEGRELEGHREVNAVALSADGKTAISASSDKTLKVWDVKTGQVRRMLTGHTRGVHAVALSVDGKTVVSGSSDSTLKVWDVKTGQVRRTLEGHAGRVNAVVLSVDGKTAISASTDKTLRVWDVETGQVCRTLKSHFSTVEAVALSADGKTAISASADKTLKVWSVETGHVRPTPESHDWGVNAVALSGDGKTAVSASGSKALKVWDVKTGQVRHTLEGHTGTINTVALSGNGETAVSGSDDRTLKVWDTRTGQVRRTLEGHTFRVMAVTLSVDGKTAISGSVDGTLTVWAVEGAEKHRTFEGHAGVVNAVVLSADRKTAVSASSDGTLSVWNVRLGRARWVLKGHSGVVNAVALSADGNTVVSASGDGTFKVWDVKTGLERRMLKGRSGAVNAVALSADGKVAVSASNDRALRVWDVETGDCLTSFTGEARFTAAVLSQTMRLFAGDSAGHVHLLELRLGQGSPICGHL